MGSALQSVVLACATLSMIVLGLGVVFFVMFCPLFELLLLRYAQGEELWIVIVVGLTLELIHLWLLWVSVFYLSLFRKLLFIVRKLAMSIVMVVVRIECIREQSVPLYMDLSQVFVRDGEDEVDALLRHFRPSVRRRYRKMEQAFRRDRIRCESVRSEDGLNLSQVIPIMWEHERRCCTVDGKSVVGEFLKRFLVMVMTTNAILDLYYDQENTLCSVQLSVPQSGVLHWFMYFSVNTRSGIWYHGILNALVRGMKTDSIRFVSGQNHQTASKQGAGLIPVDLNDPVMSSLYPVAFTRELPRDYRTTGLWSWLDVPPPPTTSSQPTQHSLAPSS